MKVCCGSGKPYEPMSDIEKLDCYSTDHCLGPIEVEDFDLLLTGFGTFNPDDCISYEYVKHLFTTKQCTQSCTNCNLLKNEEDKEWASI